jgi:type I restriction enzyme S subunit
LKADELLTSNIYPGEIIIAKMAHPVARACFVPSCDERYVMSSDGIRIVVDERQFSKKFVLQSINSTYFNKLAVSNSTGTTRLRIGLKDLKALPFVKPRLPEQKKIADILSTLDDKISALRQEKKEQIQLKKGLMQKLLTGEVRVNAS